MALGERFDYIDVKALSAPEPVSVSNVKIGVVDLTRFDRMLRPQLQHVIIVVVEHAIVIVVAQVGVEHHLSCPGVQHYPEWMSDYGE